MAAETIHKRRTNDRQRKSHRDGIHRKDDAGRREVFDFSQIHRRTTPEAGLFTRNRIPCRRNQKRSYADFCKICETSEESAEVAGLDLKIEIVTLLQDIIDMGGTGAKKGTYDDGWDSAIGEVVKLFTERFSLQIDNGEQQEEDEK